MPYKASIGICMIALLCFLQSPKLNAQDLRFPLRAEINSSPEPGLALRAAPPSATAFSYSLAERLCGLANGSIVVATNQVVVANGEIWFQVTIQEASNYIGETCPAQGSGWMIAKMKSRWVLTILEQGIELPPPEEPRRVVVTVKTGSLQEEDEKGGVNFAADYILLILGTLFGAVVVTVERVRSLNPKQWPIGLLTFEAVTLLMTNGIFCLLLKDDFYVAAETSAATSLLKVIDSSPAGYALLGFVLSVILAKFMSFAKP